MPVGAHRLATSAPLGARGLTRRSLQVGSPHWGRPQLLVGRSGGHGLPPPRCYLLRLALLQPEGDDKQPLVPGLAVVLAKAVHPWAAPLALWVPGLLSASASRGRWEKAVLAALPRARDGPALYSHAPL